MVDWEAILAPIGGTAGVVGVVAAILRGTGHLHFGKRNGVTEQKTKKCPDPECHESVAVMAAELGSVKENVGIIRDNQRNFRIQLGAVADNVSFIKGKMEKV